MEETGLQKTAKVMEEEADQQKTDKAMEEETDLQKTETVTDEKVTEETDLQKTEKAIEETDVQKTETAMEETGLQKTEKVMEENLGFKDLDVNDNPDDDSPEQLMGALEFAMNKIRSLLQAQKKMNTIDHGNTAFSQLPLTESTTDFNQQPPPPPPSPLTACSELLGAEDTWNQGLGVSNDIFDGYGHFESDDIFNFIYGSDFDGTPSPLRDLDDEDCALIARLNELQRESLNSNSNTVGITGSPQTATPLLQHGDFQSLLLPDIAASDFDQNSDVKDEPLLGTQETLDRDLGFQNSNSNAIDITGSPQTATPLLQLGYFQSSLLLPDTPASDFNQSTDVKDEPLRGTQETLNQDLLFQENNVTEDTTGLPEESDQLSTASGSTSSASTSSMSTSSASTSSDSTSSTSTSSDSTSSTSASSTITLSAFTSSASISSASPSPASTSSATSSFASTSSASELSESEQSECEC